MFSVRAEAHAVPVVKGIVYDTDGSLLKSVIVNVTVTDSTGKTIGTAKSSGVDASFVVTFTGTALADHIMNVSFQRTGGTGTLAFNNFSWTAVSVNLCPIVPK
jgi:hypothetical protein